MPKKESTVVAPPPPVASDKKDFWLVPGIIVKVKNKTVGNGSYYDKKGCIVEVIDHYVGVVKMMDTKHLLKVDQVQLETSFQPLEVRLLLSVDPFVVRWAF